MPVLIVGKGIITADASRLCNGFERPEATQTTCTATRQMLGEQLAKSKNYQVCRQFPLLPKSNLFYSDYSLIIKPTQNEHGSDRLMELQMTKSGLERDFDKEMMNIYHRAKSEANYNATLFLTMLSKHGGIETARKLIHSKTPSDGYTALWERGRLDLTVEAIIHDGQKWHPLFEEETLQIAAKRLKEYEYKFKEIKL